MVSKLKILRVARDLSQDRLAELTGFSQSRISRIERGTIIASSEEMAVILKFLGTDPIEVNPKVFLKKEEPKNGLTRPDNK